MTKPKNHPQQSGYTLVELIVAVGLFAFVMTLSSGAYLMMIGLNRQAQGIATGIDDLSFALETMTRDIRTGSAYSCGGIGDCDGMSSFSFVNRHGVSVTYSLSDASLVKMSNSVNSTLTDPSVTISSLMFYAAGTRPAPLGDYQQSHVVIIVSGTVSTGAGKEEPFTVETSATMRGTDI